MKVFYAGNLLLMLCCAFYLAWWLIAFRPKGAIRGPRSGWLLIPAAIFGIAAVVLICKGISAVPDEEMLFPAWRIAVFGVIAYVVLLAGTRLILKRPVTTELFLIVGWAALSSAEAGALYGIGAFGRTAALVLTAAILILAALSLVCYVLYYNLDSVKGYYDGMIPLGIGMVMSGVLCILMAV